MLRAHENLAQSSAQSAFTSLPRANRGLERQTQQDCEGRTNAA